MESGLIIYLAFARGTNRSATWIVALQLHMYVHCCSIRCHKLRWIDEECKKPQVSTSAHLRHRKLAGWGYVCRSVDPGKGQWEVDEVGLCADLCLFGKSLFVLSYPYLANESINAMHMHAYTLYAKLSSSWGELIGIFSTRGFSFQPLSWLMSCSAPNYWMQAYNCFFPFRQMNGYEGKISTGMSLNWHWNVLVFQDDSGHFITPCGALYDYMPSLSGSNTTQFGQPVEVWTDIIRVR